MDATIDQEIINGLKAVSRERYFEHMGISRHVLGRMEDAGHIQSLGFDRFCLTGAGVHALSKASNPEAAKEAADDRA